MQEKTGILGKHKGKLFSPRGIEDPGFTRNVFCCKSRKLVKNVLFLLTGQNNMVIMATVLVIQLEKP
jgi:hypothetical protein